MTASANELAAGAGAMPPRSSTVWQDAKFARGALDAVKASQAAARARRKRARTKTGS